MHEDNYKDLQQRIISKVCVFEKSILQRFANCDKAQKHLLAEREAINCDSHSCHTRCQQLHNELRSRARFSLQLTSSEGPLPHNKELQIQLGALLGLQQLNDKQDPVDITNLLDNQYRFENDEPPITDIDQLLGQAIIDHGDLSKLPYPELIRAINRSRIRPLRNRKK